ncbi:hypothetical protein D3C80_2098590 [compost metagenome]
MAVRREAHEAIQGKAVVEAAIGVIPGHQAFLREIDRSTHQDATVVLHCHVAEPGIHQQVPDHHEATAIEGAVQ